MFNEQAKKILRKLIGIGQLSYSTFKSGFMFSINSNWPNQKGLAQSFRMWSKMAAI